jgi:acetylglutamate kinase
MKVGGRLVETDAGSRVLAAAVSRFLASPAGAAGVVIVHGGGAQVSALGRRLGLDAAFHEGQRVTDPDTLRLVSMVLSGEVNKRIVRALLGAGVRSAGMSGEDGGTILAEVAQEGALGRVGRVDAVDTTLIHALLRGGWVPVVSPVSLGTDGAALNVNADGAAVALAVALAAGRLLFLSDVPAVRDGAGVEVLTLTTSDAERLVRSGAADGGMIPKLAAAREALAGGVGEVRVGSLGALAGGGTRVVADAGRAVAGAAVAAIPVRGAGGGATRAEVPA